MTGADLFLRSWAVYKIVLGFVIAYIGLKFNIGLWALATGSAWVLLATAGYQELRAELRRSEQRP